MLERVPAAAESTAHFFLRSVEKPVRSSRVLDPRFWRNGADDIDSSAWWPSYLQRVRTVPQTDVPTCEDGLTFPLHPTARHAQSSCLRNRRDLPSLNGRALHNGSTPRSYSVSASAGQATSPQFTDDIEDVKDQGSTGFSRRSNGITKEQGRSTADIPRARSGTQASKHAPQKVHSGASAAVPSNQKSRSTQQHLKAFDLTINAARDRLDDDSVPWQLRRSDAHLSTSRSASSGVSAAFPSDPSRVKNREKSTTHAIATPGVQKKKQAYPKTNTSRDEYESFDLNSLHNRPAQYYAGAFDLETVIQRERGSDGKSFQSPTEIEYMSSAPIGIPETGDSVTDVKPDLFQGWQYSNSFASLVPAEDRNSDNLQDLSAMPTEQLTKQPTELNESPVDSLERLAETTVKKPKTTLLAKSSKQDHKPPEAPKREARASDTLSQRMNASLEASWVPLPGLNVPLRDQERLEQYSTPPKEVLEAPTSDPKRARFDALLKIKEDAKMEHFDEAWSLFLSFDNQESLAPYMFRLLTRSQESKHLPKALAAFNIIPRSRRKGQMYQAAMHIELKRHQHGSAMNLAFEAEIRGFDLLPKLFAYLVKNLLWRSVAELLHRNINARQDFAQFAQFALAPETSAVVEREMLPLSKLLRACDGISDLHTKVLSLAERVQSLEFASMEHSELLQRLCRYLAIQAVRSPAVLTDITPQALLAILDINDRFGNLKLHEKALETIFDLPERGDKLNLALMVYRNLRFKKPGKSVPQLLVKNLITLCGEAEQSSTDLYDYLLEQFVPRPSVETFHQVMVYCARKGNSQAVRNYLETFIQQFGIPKRVAPVNALIHAYAVEGDTIKARQTLESLSKDYGLEPDTVSWNMLMLAHVRSDDDIAAFDISEEMKQKRVKFNEYTYGQLLAVCAAHGDTEAALDVLVDARDDHIQVTIPMLNTVVQTYLKNDNPQAALRFAMAATESGNKADLTRLWNSFVRFFAFKGETLKLMQIRSIMARYDIPPDGMTYAAMMTLLTSTRRTSEAMKLLRQMHQQEKLPVTMIHYSMILNGFVAEGNRDAAYLIFDEMKQRFPDISASANAAMLSLQASRDGRVQLQGPEKDSSHGVKMLAELLKDISSVKGSQFNAASGMSRQDRTAVSMYFETIVRALIRSGSYDSAQQLVKHVDSSLITNMEGRSARSSPAGGMVLARMDIAIERQDWAQFERLWDVAFKDAIKAYSSIPTSRESQRAKQEGINTSAIPSSQGKFSLNLYLNRYMEAMARQHRQSEMRKFFQTKLFPSGFAFTGKNWNKYVQVLCRSDNLTEQVRAFKVFEHTMRVRTQTWDLLVRGKMRKRLSHYAWQPYGQRNRPILQRQNRFRDTKRIDQLRFHPQQKIPTYLTAVHLGAVLIKAQQRAQQGLVLQLHSISRRAPRTKKFIQMMPRLKDDIQGSILRSLDGRPNRETRPRSEESLNAKTDLAGLIGDQSPLNHMPMEYLEDVEEITGRKNVVRSLLKDNSSGRGRTQQHQERADVELGEMFTGQISRTPIVLAGQGRLETISEMQRRVSREEQQKRDSIQRLREELTARSSVKDTYRPALRAEPPPGFRASSKLDMKPQRADASISRLLALPDTSRAKTKGQNSSSSADTSKNKLNRPLGTIPVSQQLDNLAKARERGNKELEARAQMSTPIPPLAIPFMNQRRLRRRLALGQRIQARQELETLKDKLSPRAYVIRTAAAKRLEAFEQSRRRRRAVLAYERDVKAGKRLDPFPKTLAGLQRRRFIHGPVTVRFVSDLKRKKKNYLVRRGVLYERRQRPVQTLESKGKTYVTRWDRVRQWLDSHYLQKVS